MVIKRFALGVDVEFKSSDGQKESFVFK